MEAKKVGAYTPTQRQTIADIGRAASLMGLTQADAAKRASEVLGVNVSTSSVCRCLMDEPAVKAAAEEEPETLFEWANMETSAAIVARLDEIIKLMKEKR